MRFVTRLESAQDGDGVIDRRFAHLHWLKASLERGVFLDMLAILVEGGRADAAQFAASKRGLEQLSRADRAFARSWIRAWNRLLPLLLLLFILGAGAALPVGRRFLQQTLAAGDTAVWRIPAALGLAGRRIGIV